MRVVVSLSLVGRFFDFAQNDIIFVESLFGGNINYNFEGIRS